MLCVHAKVYDRLQKLHISVSHKTAIRLLDNFSDIFDRDVLKWKDELAERVLNCTNINQVSYMNVEIHAWDVIYIVVHYFHSLSHIHYCTSDNSNNYFW